tara:strand:- start:27 stop:1004 length:978 start_codon:yes stop_codon:yes gene_type:complete
MPSKGKGKKKKKRGGTPAHLMDFSAAESLIPPLNIDFNVGPGTSGGGFFDEKLAELETLQEQVREQSANRLKLQKLIDIKKGKVTYTNPIVARVNQNTTRVVKGLKTKSGEFVYNDGKRVKEDTQYHIHYTKALEKYYMTEHQHSNTSRIIFPVKIKDDFTIYNTLSEQTSLKIESTTIAPTEDDYNKGFINRSFARKANEPGSAPFEIKRDQIDTSPLYIYANLNFMIAGTRARVKAFNNDKVTKAARFIPNLKKFINPFQFYREKGNEDIRESILEKLKVSRLDSTPTESTTEQATQQTTTTTTPSSGGPPPGVMTGGAGGAY